MSEKTFRHIFLRKLSPKHYFNPVSSIFWYFLNGPGFYVNIRNINFSKPCLIKIRVGQFHRIEFLTHVQVDIFQTQRFKSVWIWLLSHSSVTWEVTFEISCLHFVPIKLVSFFGGTYCWVINRVTSKYTFLLWLKDQYS